MSSARVWRDSRQPFRHSGAARASCCTKLRRTRAGAAAPNFDSTLGITVDNGNHLLLSGNQSAMVYLRATDTLIGPTQPEYPFFDLASGGEWTVRMLPGRLPRWIVDADARVPTPSPPIICRSCSCRCSSPAGAHDRGIGASSGPCVEPARASAAAHDAQRRFVRGERDRRWQLAVRNARAGRAGIARRSSRATACRTRSSIRRCGCCSTAVRKSGSARGSRRSAFRARIPGNV